ncbi:MAG: hypothetical protein HY537_06265, partial [Deltaproteobacteria bacterium]|nr:hypothetical protein [Deltaproteobacteria bacterium]
ALILLVFCWPIFENLQNLGIWDWDQHLFYFGSFVKTVKEYHQLPLWNPWHCGGNGLLQNPQIPLVSPVYLLSVIFSVPTALKINIYLHYLVGALGTLAIANAFRVSNAFIYLAAASIFIFNGSLVWHIRVGHTHFLSSCIWPWIFFCYLRTLATHRLRWLLSAAMLLAFIIFEGGFYPATYIALFLFLYSAIRAALQRNWKPFTSVMQIGVYALLFSAPKVVPIVDFMRYYPRHTDAAENVPLTVWPKIFLDRHQDDLVSTFHSVFPSQRWLWHEYGCYIGILAVAFVLAAFCFSSVQMVRQLTGKQPKRDETECAFALTCSFVAFAILMLGNFAHWSPYQLLHRLPPFSSLRDPSRFVLMMCFVGFLLVLRVTASLKIRVPRMKLTGWLIALLSIVMLSDLVTVNRKLFHGIFSLSPPIREITHPTNVENYVAVNDLPSYGSFSALYLGLLTNRSVVNCYEDCRPKLGYVLGAPLVYAMEPTTQISMIRFTPNRISFSVKAPTETVIFLNQNFVKGWRFNQNNVPVNELQNKPFIRLGPGDYPHLSFYFLPSSLFVGLACAGIGACLASGHSIWRARRSPAKPHML